MPTMNQAQAAYHCQKQGGKIHRMPDQPIHAGRNDFLPLFDADIGNCICVDL